MSLANRAQQTSSTKGTATYVLDGTKPGRQRLSTAMAKVAERLGLAGGEDGPWTVRYTATDQTGRHEVGYGTLTRGTAGAFDTLSRDEILDSAANDGAVNWPTGTRTITVTIDGGAVASLLDLNAPLGPVQRTGRDRYGWGLVADGETDNAAALEAAINASGGLPIDLPPGTLKVNRALAITAAAFHLRGARGERGQVKGGQGTIIDATAIPAGDWLCDVYSTTAPLTNSNGPFVVEQVEIRMGVANGFQFGRPDLDNASQTDRAHYDVVTDTGNQRFTHGVHFDEVKMIGTAAVHASDAGGVIARSGQRLIRLTKAFECVISNSMLERTDVAIEIWGCDTPTIERCRINYCHVPILMQNSGSFSVAHRIRDFQTEHYTFGAIVTSSCMVDASGIRVEGNLSAPAKHGRWDMTGDLGITAAVTAGSGIVVFSQDMTGILWAGLSLIEVSDGAGNTDTCLVQAVAGTDVTVWTTGFAFDWSDATASVVRIHGYGVMHGGTYGANIMGGHVDPFVNCPTFVNWSQSGSMIIAGVLKNPGTNGDVRSLCLGNRVGNAPNYSRGMVFVGCSTSLLPVDPAHPHVHIVDQVGSMGMAPHQAGIRLPKRDPWGIIAQLPGRRVVALDPSNYTYSAFDNTLIKVIDGDANTNQRFAAWKVAASTVLNFGLPTVPSVVPTKPTQIRWGIVARTVSGAAGTLAVQTVGNSGSASLSYPVAGAIDCIEVIENGIPPQWTGSRTTVPPGLRITPAQDTYILGVYMIEEPLNVLESAFVGRASGRKVPVAKSVATGICTVTCERASSGFVHVRFRNSATIRGGNQGYCYVNGEWSITFSSQGGTPKLVGTVQQLWKTQDSVNTGVFNIDVAVTAAVSGQVLTISVEYTVGGSSAGTVTECIGYWACDVLGDDAHLVNPL